MAKGDKKRFLKVATPDEWDRWLNTIADIHAPARMSAGLDYCLFCRAVGATSIGDGNKWDCGRCMPGHFSGYLPCAGIPRREKVDRAIERLNRAGIFDDQDIDKC
jgi:hypothetical protein